MTAPDEAARLRALARYDETVLAGDATFEQLVALAADVCGTPIATLSLVDDTRQHFRVRRGFDLDSTPREHAFCVHTLARGDVLVVSDAREDERFADNPLVTGLPGVRAYAGAPLVTDDGYALGTLCVIDVHPHEFSDEQQRLLRVLATQAMTQLELRRTMRDTDRQRRALAAATLERRRILDQSVDVLCINDTDGMFVEVSQSAYEVWGRPPEDVVGRHWSEVVHPDDHAAAQRFLRDVIRGNGRAFHMVTRCMHRDGHAVWMRWSSRWSADDARGYSVARDITEQKASEVVLLDREIRLREQAALLEMASDAVLTRGLDGRVRFWNGAAGRLFGWNASEVIGRAVDDLLEADPARAAEATRVLLETHTWAGELVRRTRSGETLTVYSRWTLLLGPTGEPTGILEINSDVTEARQIQAQLLRAQRLDSLGTLARGIAHDLNNMLAPVLMAVDVLRDQVRDDLGRDVLGIIEASVHKGAGLVRQVQAFARGVAGERAMISSDTLVRDVARMVADSFPPSITVSDDVPDDLWPINGDLTELQQVLLHLAANARDAMPAGGDLLLSAANVQLDEREAAVAGGTPGAYVRIAVADTGTGIEPDVREHIFDPFYSTKELGKGSGLGLSTTLGIVRQHGGFIDLQSQPGRGATFTVYLPALVEGQTGRRVPASTPGVPRGSDELVLVIDDESSVRSMTRSVLETYGYRVVTAADGAEGVSTFAAHQHEVAAVITDMMMPVMDGYATIRALRRLSPSLRILAASGLAAGGMQERAAAAGVTHFIAKPFTAETLLVELDALLRDPQRSGTVQ